eukprot:m.130628 g.130628  ORF g.130628 m.130628 type:complete len:1726 (-) comp9469_c0_seq1:486-5663(-)
MGCTESKEGLRPNTTTSISSSDVDVVELELGLQTLWNKPRSERDAWKKILDDIASNPFPYTERPQHLYADAVAGKLLDLSQLTLLGVKRPSIRLFLSSTFTDTEIERNVLIEDVQPFLRLVGQKVGVQVHQSSEMRWGIRAEASSSHKTSEICMNEIDRCQQDSSGMAYVLILGNKFGFRPFPAKIPETEFLTLVGQLESLNEAFIQHANENLQQAKKTRLSISTSPEQQLKIMEAQSDLDNNVYEKALKYIEEWYILDKNYVPPTRVLQPVPSELSSEWWSDVFPSLQQALRDASEALEDKNRSLLYKQSVTAEEIARGLLDVQDSMKGTSCFVFDRTFDGIDVMHKDARFFMDIMNKTHVDDDAQGHLEELRSSIIPGAISPSNIKTYKLQWGEGFTLSNPDHADYIRKFADDFCSVIVDSIVKVAQENHFDSDELMDEVTNQAKFGNDRRKMFVSNAATRKTSDRAVEYVNNKFFGDISDKHAFAVCGVSGSGKTSLMAHISGELSEKYAQSSDAVVVTRFLGTSRNSTNARAVILSIAKQLTMAVEGTATERLDNLAFEPLIVQFKKLLATLGKKKKIVLVLDSLDQLTDQYNGRKLGWLPLVTVPENVAILVSSLPDVGGCWDVLSGVLPNESHCVHVQQINEEDAAEILMLWLKSQGRKITQLQLEAVMGAYKNTPTPLYLMMCAEFFALKWHHDFNVDAAFFPSDVKDLMDLVLDEVEVVHGKGVVRAVLTYLTASQGGLSDAEMGDLLSLNDDVLDEVFEWWVPPVRRIPPLIFTRIISDLRGTIVQRGAEGGVTVNAWFHRQHWETATRRYLSDLDDLVHAHVDLANYFSGKYEAGKAITHRKRRSISTNNNANGNSSGQEVKQAQGGKLFDRKVTPMPLALVGNVFNGVDEMVVNARKVSVLPYHLTKGRMWQSCAAVLTSLEFLQAKCMAKMVPDLLEDYNGMLATCPADVLEEFELSKWSKFVSSNSHDFVRNGWSVVPRATCTPEWSSICRAARAVENENMHAIPSTHMYAKPNRENLRYALLKNLGGNVTAITFTRDGKYVCGGTEKGRICIFDVVRAEVVFRLITPLAVGNRFPPAIRNLFHLPNGELLSLNKDVFTYWNVKTGEVLRECSPLPADTYVRDAVLSTDDSRIIVSYSDSDQNYFLSCFATQGDMEMCRLENIPSAKNIAVKGSKIVCTGFDGEVVWYNFDVAAGKLEEDKVCALKEGSSTCGVVFATDDVNDGNFDVIVAASKTVVLLSYETGESTKTGSLNSTSYSLAKVCRGKFLAIGDFDETLEVFDMDTFKHVISMKNTMTGAIATSPDTNLVASGGTNFSDISVFDAGGLPGVLQHDPDPESLAYFIKPQMVMYQNTHAVVVAGPSPKIQVLNATTFEVLKSYHLGDESFTPSMMAARNDGRFLVTSIRKGAKTVIIDLQEDKMHKDVFSHDSNVPKRAFFSPNGDRVIAMNEYGSFCLVSLPECKVIASSLGKKKKEDGSAETVFHTSEIVQATFHPKYDENGMMLTASSDCSGKLWDARKGELIRTLHGNHDSGVSGAVFCPGNMIATVDDDDPTPLLQFWSIDDESVCIGTKMVTEYPNNNVCNPVSLHWSTYSDLLISSAINQKVKLWNTKGELVHAIDRKVGAFVPFHTIPRFFLTNSFGGAEVVDTKTWKTVLYIVGHDSGQGGCSITLSPDNHFMASYGSDKKIIVHSIGEILRGRQGLLAPLVKSLRS